MNNTDTNIIPMPVDTPSPAILGHWVDRMAQCEVDARIDALKLRAESRRNRSGGFGEKRKSGIGPAITSHNYQ